MDDDKFFKSVLAPFDVVSFQPGHLAVHHQFWAVQRLVQEKPDLTGLIRHQAIFHCSPVFHDLLLKLLSSSGTDFETVLVSELTGRLWTSFENADNDTDHCLCSSIRLLHRLSKFDASESAICSLLKPYWYRAADNRCSAYHYLKYCHLLLSERPDWKACHRVLADLFLQNSSPIYSGHFGPARDFVGNVIRPPAEAPNQQAAEWRYDCVLIRCHVLAFIQSLRLRSSDIRFSLFSRFWNQVFPGDCQTETMATSLMDVFINEDGELFEMLHLVATVIDDIPGSDYLLHRLWNRFVLAISQDADTLMALLGETDGETAQNCLKFLLVYLKILANPNAVPDDMMAPIRRTLADLRVKLAAKYRAGQFPYNPKPLLRLLSNAV